MKNTLRSFATLVSVLAFTGWAHAAPTTDVISVQGYMKRSNNTNVSETSFDGVFAVFAGSTCLWARAMSSQPLSNGYFATTLSGNGSDMTVAGNWGSHGTSTDRTACSSNYSGISLSSTLIGAATGALKAKVFVTSAVDTNKYPAFDITIGGAPVAMYAGTAGNLAGLSGSQVVVTNNSGNMAGITLGSGQVVTNTGSGLGTMNVLTASSNNSLSGRQSYTFSGTAASPTLNFGGSAGIIGDANNVQFVAGGSLMATFNSSALTLGSQNLITNSGSSALRVRAANGSGVVLQDSAGSDALSVNAASVRIGSGNLLTNSGSSAFNIRAANASGLVLQDTAQSVALQVNASGVAVGSYGAFFRGITYASSATNAVVAGNIGPNASLATIAIGAAGLTSGPTPDVIHCQTVPGGNSTLAGAITIRAWVLNTGSIGIRLHNPSAASASVTATTGFRCVIFRQ
ncbi:MAG: hypothetical protein LW875_05685 [Proteobacteria bacterium]|jgi:hypothetical protein|nr:hypothetical protein [Pseudomonadota bacterium]